MTNLRLLGALPEDSNQNTEDGRFLVKHNISLPTCQAEEIAEQLIAEGYQGTVEIGGNDDEAECVE